MVKKLGVGLMIIGALFIGVQLVEAVQSHTDNILFGIADYDAVVSDTYNCDYNVSHDSISTSQIRERAFLMGSVEWTPKHDIPNNSGRFKKGETVTGLPYSSVKELQKFIGLDVSIYTFLTAVNNPYSLLYTENVAQGNPCYLGGIYNGKNSHTFYGTVCSSFTAFCYGENNNYGSFNYRDGDMTDYLLKQDQSLNSIENGDLFWCPGHVALITNVNKDDYGNTTGIELFESAGDKVQSKLYSPAAFGLRMSGKGNPKNKAYLYKNKLVKSPDSNSVEEDGKVDIKKLLASLPIDNQEICTWFGDRACMGEWDRLVINFDKRGYDRILISLDDKIIDTLDISNIAHSIEYNAKEFGIYKAQLASDSAISQNFTSFEVLDTRTKIVNNKDGYTEVIFPDNSTPDIVYWVNKPGYQYTFPITVSEEEKKCGSIKIETINKPGTTVRVIYRGKYGRAINKPEHLFQESI